MLKIKYEFTDGTINEVEVTEEFYAIYEELENEEKRNNKRETRRHISLNYLNESGIDFADANADPYFAIIRREDEERIHKAILTLSNKQRTLLGKIFNENMSLREISRQTGISHQALSQQLATIYKKLKKHL